MFNFTAAAVLGVGPQESYSSSTAGGEQMLLAAAAAAASAAAAQSPLTLTPSTPSITHFVNDSFIIFCKTVQKDIDTKWRDPSGQTRENTKGRVHIEKKTGKQSASSFTDSQKVPKGAVNYAGAVKVQVRDADAFLLPLPHLRSLYAFRRFTGAGLRAHLTR